MITETITAVRYPILSLDSTRSYGFFGPPGGDVVWAREIRPTPQEIGTLRLTRNGSWRLTPAGNVEPIPPALRRPLQAAAAARVRARRLGTSAW